MTAGRPFGKVDIVHLLADRYACRRYLDLATPTTGNYYSAIDRSRFEACRRLMYRCPADYADGLAIDYRCADLDIAPALAAIQADGRRFDLMLVDPFHTYAASARDLAAAFALLEPGGALVVHDCLPPNEALAVPHFKPGAWCGVTYKAFLDFVLARRDLRYLTVDADYGCGVIRKLKPRKAGLFAVPLGRAGGRRERGAAWPRLGGRSATTTTRPPGACSSRTAPSC